MTDDELAQWLTRRVKLAHQTAWRRVAAVGRVRPLRSRKTTPMLMLTDGTFCSPARVVRWETDTDEVPA